MVLRDHHLRIIIANQYSNARRLFDGMYLLLLFPNNFIPFFSRNNVFCSATWSPLWITMVED